MKRLLTAVVTVALLAGSITIAHADGRDHRRGGYDRHDDRYKRQHHRDHRRGWADQHRHRHAHAYVQYHRPHGYHQRAWRRGDHLPIAYRAHRYYVVDYRAHRLRAPPRGYHWIRVDDDLLLTALATGLVVQVVHGMF